MGFALSVPISGQCDSLSSWNDNSRIPRFFMIHIGQLIKQELELQERTPSWLARKINCERPNVNNIFERKSIDTDLLLLISKALNKDFFEILSKELTQQ